MDRKLLKDRAKNILRRDYKRILLAIFVVSMLSLDFISADQTYDQFGNVYGTLTIFNIEFPFSWAAALGFLLLIYALFVGSVLDYGITNHLKYIRMNQGIEFDYFDGFKNNYQNIVCVNLMVGLRVFLWALLFIVPGFIKAYEYSFVNEILEEHPDWDYKMVLEESSRLTYGYKWQLFVLDISFILWILVFAVLDIFTLGLASYLLRPYTKMTNVEAYFWLKETKNISTQNAIEILQNENPYE